MANAMVALANITLGSSAATVTFSSIPATYRDLRLVINGKTTIGQYSTIFEINGDTGSNYYRVYFTGNGSTTTSATSATTYAILADENPTTPGIDILDFMDYSATDKHKSIIYRNNVADTSSGAGALRWANTAAITSFKIGSGASTWMAGSTFSLYGIVS